MAERDALEAAVSAVEDPLLRRSLGSLGMIDEIAVKRFGTSRVQLFVPVPNYPHHAELDRRVKEAAAAATGVGVTVDTTVMEDGQRDELVGYLRRSAGPGLGEPGSRTRVVAVSSGKGGVGKSSVTTNLAVAVAGLGKKVGVIDADIWGFSIPRMLGVGHAPVVISEAIVPPIAHDVRAMSMDYFVGEDQAVIWRGPMLHKAIEQFLKDVWWDALDVLLVDMPPGTGDVSISLSQLLPRAAVLVVTTPQHTAQRVARRAALMARQVDQEVIGVVENMSWFTGDDGTRYRLFGEGGGQGLSDELGVPLMAQVPLLPAMRQGADVGEPVAVAAPESEVAAAFAGLAEAVLAYRPRVRTHPDLVIR